MANQIQIQQLRAYNLRRSLGQLKSCLYVEGYATHLDTGRTVITPEYTEEIEAYSPRIKKTSDYGVKVSENDIKFKWTAINNDLIQRKEPRRDFFVYEIATEKLWRITNSKQPDSWGSIFEVNCKPYSVGQTTIQVESIAEASVSALAESVHQVTDNLWIRPPAGTHLVVTAEWEVIPGTTYGPPQHAFLCRYQHGSQIQVYGVGDVELELQRSLEPIGSQVWNGVGLCGVSVGGNKIIGADFTDGPGLVSVGSRLLYRLRARSGGSVEIQSSEISIKSQMITQDETAPTAGRLEVQYDFNQVLAPVLVGQIPDGSKAVTSHIVVTSAFDGDLEIEIGTDSTNDLLMDSTESKLSEEDGHFAFNNLLVVDDIKIFASYTVAPSQGSATITVYYQ